MLMFTKAHVTGARRNEVVNAIKSGKTIAFPTDLGYFIGCVLGNKEAVARARAISHKRIQETYVIPPSAGWISENFDINKDARNWVSKLPGAYALIFNFKKESSIGEGEAGIIVPNHWFNEILKEVGSPMLALDVGMSDFYDLDFN